jgi:predicted DNA-binding protein (MmcQ/YjbR family)
LPACQIALAHGVGPCSWTRVGNPVRQTPGNERDWSRPWERAEAPNLVIGAAELRALCLGFAGSAETFPFGSRTSVFKVGGKMFALSQLAESPLRVSLKCEPPLAEQLRAAHSAVLPGYHLNKRHWNTVLLDGSLPEQTLRDMIEDSYDLVVSGLPRPRRQALGWEPAEQ